MCEKVIDNVTTTTLFLNHGSYMKSVLCNSELFRNIFLAKMWTETRETWWPWMAHLKLLNKTQGKGWRWQN